MLCNLCPRGCNIDRKSTTGYCKSSDTVKIARVMLHKWEEPCISLDPEGAYGSGAIFFSGCPLKCVYCQNRDISHNGYGKEYTVEELAQEMLRLQEMGAYNINLVTPTHYSDKIRMAIDLIRPKLSIPVVYNTSGYELDTEIEKMAGYVDVFLTDIKYFSNEYALRYSKCNNYYEMAKKSLLAMLKIAPEPIYNEKGLMVKGVIVRHLVLPGLRRDSMAILQDLRDSIDISKIKLSLMSQYTFEFCDEKFKELRRNITTFEYESVVNTAISLGYDGYIQDKSASTSAFTPKFK